MCRKKLTKGSASLLDLDADRNSVQKDMDFRPEHPTMFKVLNGLLKRASVATLSLSDFWKTIQEQYKETRGVLSLQDAERLFTLCEERGLNHHPKYNILQHMITAISEMPWNLTRAGSGRCYYGNFGDTPQLLEMHYYYRYLDRVIETSPDLNTPR